MLALGAANFLGVLLFGTLYAVAGAGLIPQRAFLVCAGLLFVLVTVTWVSTERRHRHLTPLARFGRAAGGLAIAVIATPVLVLMPAFWLDSQLPPEAGLNRLLGPIMALVLMSLVLVGLVNLAGGVVTAVLGLRGPREQGGASG